VGGLAVRQGDDGGGERIALAGWLLRQQAAHARAPAATAVCTPGCLTWRYPCPRACSRTARGWWDADQHGRQRCAAQYSSKLQLKAVQLRLPRPPVSNPAPQQAKQSTHTAHTLQAPSGVSTRQSSPAISRCHRALSSPPSTCPTSRRAGRQRGCRGALASTCVAGRWWWARLEVSRG